MTRDMLYSSERSALSRLGSENVDDGPSLSDMLIGHIASVSVCEVVDQVIEIGDDDRQDLGSVRLDQWVLVPSASSVVHSA